jgi:hypothetical protein
MDPMNNRIPAAISIVQDVLDAKVKLKKSLVGLNYAAYAVQTYPAGTSGEADLQIVYKSYNEKYLKYLLKRFSGPSDTLEEQVLLWDELLSKVHRVTLGLDDELVKTGQGQNVRIVLDVDMGGFFYNRINSHAILFGATLDQAQVNNGSCDIEMQQMVSEIQAVFTAHGA